MHDCTYFHVTPVGFQISKPEHTAHTIKIIKPNLELPINWQLEICT